MSLFRDDYIGTFVDVGCQKPETINNTLMLEERGWFGISVDIIDYSKEWLIRKNPFVCENALSCDYLKLFNKYNLPKAIDYLSLDVEGNGDRFLALSKIFDSGYDFKIITIEHDAYRGYGETERKRQREFLTKNSYFLLCSNVKLDNLEFEDWWVNPNYFNESDYIHYLSDGISYEEILNKNDNV